MSTRARTWQAGLLAAAGGCALAGAAPATAGTSWVIRTTAGGRGPERVRGPGCGRRRTRRQPYKGDRNGVVRVLHGNSDWEITLAGVGAGATGFGGDGGRATSAELSSPQGLALGPAGNVAVADVNENRVRVVAESTGTYVDQAMTAGDICTEVGSGTNATPPSGVPAASAGLADPAHVAVDSLGNLVISERLAARLLVVARGTGTFYGQAMTAGKVYLVAGNSSRRSRVVRGARLLRRLIRPEPATSAAAQRHNHLEHGPLRDLLTFAGTWPADPARPSWCSR